MIHGKKKSLNGTFYLKKPHFCPECKTKMETITVKKTVNSKSPEAEKYDFSINRGTGLVGNVEFSWQELKCPCCDCQMTIEEMKKFELDDMSGEQLKKYEKKEKIKVALFKIGVSAFILILIICLFAK